MRKTFLGFSFLALSIITSGQGGSILAIEDFMDGLNPSENILLFDLREIKEKSIDTVYIINHPASWLEEFPPGTPCSCSYGDTLFRFVFSPNGEIIERTNYQQFGDFATTFHFDTLGNWKGVTQFRRNPETGKSTSTFFERRTDLTDYKEYFERKKIGTDSIITTTVIQKFPRGTDTGTVKVSRYNRQGRLVEVESKVNIRAAREFDYHNGDGNYHYSYDYDDKGRLILYKNHHLNEYIKISYPFYGQLIEYFDITTNNLLRQDTKMIESDEEIVTVTYGRSQIILTRLEKDSKLFKLKTILNGSKLPYLEYQEIVYKSRVLGRLPVAPFK